MNKKNLAKYIILLYQEESKIFRDIENYGYSSVSDLRSVDSVFKSVPFWDEDFIYALYIENKDNLEDGTLTEENIEIPVKKEYFVRYSARESLYNENYYETNVEGYSEDLVMEYITSSEFEWWDGNLVDTDTLDSSGEGIDLRSISISEVSNNITESKTEEKPYGECNFSAKEFINCVQNHSDLETLYMMKSIIDEEIERFERMISIAQNLDREPIGFKINKS